MKRDSDCREQRTALRNQCKNTVDIVFTLHTTCQKVSKNEMDGYRWFGYTQQSDGGGQIMDFMVFGFNIVLVLFVVLAAAYMAWKKRVNSKAFAFLVRRASSRRTNERTDDRRPSPDANERSVQNRLIFN